MNKDDIIRMAQIAGVRDDGHRFEFSEYKYLERFAELVRKDYSTTHAQIWLKRMDDAAIAERKRIVNMLKIQHEAAKGSHNYWLVAANLIDAD